MLPGPDFIYECPNCGNLLKKGSLLSGNTLGAQLFSDGKRVAPMLPEFPDLTKCNKCNTILWLSKLKAIGILRGKDTENLNWRKADNVEFLNIEDHFRALSNGLAENTQEELFIRQGLWWAYNDRVRNGKNPFDGANEEIEWRENCNKLITLLDPSDLNQRIMIAELKRNLGDFDSCLDIIREISHDKLNWLKVKFIGECEKGNRWVIKLN